MHYVIYDQVDVLYFIFGAFGAGACTVLAFYEPTRSKRRFFAALAFAMVVMLVIRYNARI